MSTLRSVLVRLASIFQAHDRDRADRELRDELQGHLQLHIDDNLRTGMNPDAARREAHLQLGGLQQTAEQHRDRRGLPTLDSLAQDVRYAVRILCRAPMWSVVAISTLALGIGGTAAIFSVVDATLLRPLSFPDPERLVAIHEVVPAMPPGQFAPVNALHVQAWAKTGAFEGIALVSPIGLSLSGAGEPEMLPAARVSPAFFATLGVQPALGRSFLADEEQPGRDRVVVIAEPLWRRRFSADPRILGRIVALDGEAHEIVGVLPAGFSFPTISHLYSLSMPGGDSPVQVWKPFAPTPQDLRPFGSFNYACVARLAAGVSREQAHAKVHSAQAAFAASIPGLTDLSAVLVPLHTQIVGRSQRGLEIALLAATAVLLIVCVNISNLLLSRSVARRHEVAIRSAIGATRGRLVRQMLAESVTLSVAGGSLGIALACTMIPLIVRYAPPGLPRLDKVQMDTRVLAFSVGLTMMVGVLVGLLPAWRFSETGAARAIAPECRTRSSGGATARVRSWLVSIEVAATAMCLMVGGLLLSSLARLLDVDPGFATQRVLNVVIDLPVHRYPASQERSAFVTRLIERVRALPGVVSAGASNSTPLTGEGASGAVLAEGATVPRPQRPRADQRFVSPDYLATMGIPLRAGRTFSQADEGRTVAVLGAATADRLWPGHDPIGQRFAIGPDDAPLWFEVVGVVGDIRTVSLDRPSPLTIYIPQWVGTFSRVSLSLKTTSNARPTAAELRQSVRNLDPELVIAPIRRMEDVVTASVSQRRFQLNLILLFAALATVLAALGIYGVVAHSVLQRTNELGIRMALGAGAGEIKRLVFVQGMKPVAFGVTAGIAGALAASGLLSAMLFGVSPSDPLTIGGVLVLMAGVATLAILMPAQRATHIDPLVALRGE